MRSYTVGMVAFALAVATLVAGTTPSASASARTHGSAKPSVRADDCSNPTPPDTFHDNLVTAIGISRDLPTGWANSPYIANIVCWQGTNFDVTFSAAGGTYHHWYGIFAMTVQEVQTIAGPWMISDQTAFHLSTKCFVWGWVKCARTTENSRIVQQIIAGLR